MNLYIKKDSELNQIIIQLGDKKVNQIIAEKDSTTWNTRAINDFLKKIVELNPDDEKIEVIPDLETLSTKEDKDLYFIVKLFTEFANEYNEKY